MTELTNFFNKELQDDGIYISCTSKPSGSSTKEYFHLNNFIISQFCIDVYENNLN